MYSRGVDQFGRWKKGVQLLSRMAARMRSKAFVALSIAKAERAVGRKIKAAREKGR